MTIIECRFCGNTIDAKEAIPVACPACGAKPTRIVARTDVPSPQQVAEVLRILDGVPDVPAEPGDEIKDDGK
jgi:hypothetical protein